jgi:hypothetical protein
MRKRRIGAAVLALAMLVAVSGCGERGVVRAKRHEHSNVYIEIYELCLGESASSCQWMTLPSAKTDRLDYQRCRIGDMYPDCIKPW